MLVNFRRKAVAISQARARIHAFLFSYSQRAMHIFPLSRLYSVLGRAQLYTAGGPAVGKQHPGPGRGSVWRANWRRCNPSTTLWAS
jgi:hypothetical protein